MQAATVKRGRNFERWRMVSLRMSHTPRLVSGALALWMAGASAALADVKMPAIFGDHMVLQQDGKIPVWGTAEPGESVKVTVGSGAAEAKADTDGRWRVELAALPSSSAATTMTITGKNSITYQDVLIGDVWLASGQSNMEYAVNGLPASGPVTAKQALERAANPQVRLFLVARQTGIFPKTDFQGKWEVCSPDTAGKFSAIAYFFGLELQSDLKRPIGLIGSYWGGTPAQTWTSLEALKSVPSEAGGVAQVQKQRDAYPRDPAAQAALMADFQAQLKSWQTNVDIPFQAVFKKWQEEAQIARAAGKPEPPRPNESSNHPNSPEGETFQPAILYDGMIAPLIPYAIKGAIWYQGESNAGGWGEGYDALLEALITDWRSRWGQGDFPFLIVGLANIDDRFPVPTDSGWAGVRDGQAKTAQKLPNTGLALALDIGAAHNIHPPDKLDVARRLVASAKHIAYGQDIVSSGPRFAGMTAEGDKVRLKYEDVGSGLAIGTAPWFSDDYPKPSSTELVGYAVAGEDKKWTWARARIEGQEVVVWSDQAPKPVAVRYGWANNPEVNLYNKEGFPAVPFRTDDWPFVPPPPH